jgi:hypothetical protein
MSTSGKMGPASQGATTRQSEARQQKASERLYATSPEYRAIIDRIHERAWELREMLARPGDVFIGARIDEIAYCLAQDATAARILNETVGLYRQAFDRLDEAGIASHRDFSPSTPYTASPAIIDVLVLDILQQQKR